MKKSILYLLLFALLFSFVSCKEEGMDETEDIAPVRDIETFEDEKAEAPVTEKETDKIDEQEEQEKEIIIEEKPEEQPKPEPKYVPVGDIKLSMSSVSLTIGQKKMPIVTMLPTDATDKGEIWESSDNAVATVDNIGNIRAVGEGECVVKVTSKDNGDVFATVSVVVVPTPECTYIDGILVVNKTYPLPSSYAPGWETEASGPLWQMIADAKKDGIELWMTSGYRSYYDQEYIYNGYVARDGLAEADTYSARPGHSEHQTGLAYDLNDLSSNFGETAAGKWVAENCHKYGFIVRYPKEKEHITGYIYEPWHIRYLGVEKATEVYESGLCLEEFLGITSCYSDAENS